MQRVDRNGRESLCSWCERGFATGKLRKWSVGILKAIPRITSKRFSYPRHGSTACNLLVSVVSREVSMTVAGTVTDFATVTHPALFS